MYNNIMSEDSSKVGWQPDGSFWGDDDDYEQWVSEHPDEAQEEDNQENESGFDADLGSYVSKQLLNGNHIIRIENNSSDFVEYDGNFVDGNALLVDENRNHSDWAKFIEKLVKNPNMAKDMGERLYETVKDKYDLNVVTKARAEFYKSIV